jgi:hypothetical protein
MELVGLVAVVMLSVGISLAGARAMLAAGLFLMTRAATVRGRPESMGAPRV